MKARLTDPKCMHLRWRKAFFDNPFTRLKYIICSPLLSLINFSWKITLARITPYTGGQGPEILNDWKCPNNSWGHEKVINDWKCPNNTGGHKRKFSITEGAHTKLGGIKKIQRIQKFWAKKSQCNGAQNQMKKTKIKRKSPTLGGHRGPFYKSNSKVQKCMNRRVWDISTSDP